MNSLHIYINLYIIGHSQRKTIYMIDMMGWWCWQWKITEANRHLFWDIWFCFVYYVITSGTYIAMDIQLFTICSFYIQLAILYMYRLRNSILFIQYFIWIIHIHVYCVYICTVCLFELNQITHLTNWLIFNRNRDQSPTECRWNLHSFCLSIHARPIEIKISHDDYIHVQYIYIII